MYIYICIKAALRERWNEEKGNEVGRDGDAMWDRPGEGGLRRIGPEGGGGGGGGAKAAGRANEASTGSGKRAGGL